MRKSFIVVDISLGADAGKGTTVDFLTRQSNATLNVRFNGGAQAAHNVVLPDGRHHTFNQFSSGSFAGAITLLSKHSLVNPILLKKEAERLSLVGLNNIIDKVIIDGRALITTPYHRALNRLREMSRGFGRHGSCGLGIGECMDQFLNNPGMALRAQDLQNDNLIKEKLEYSRAKILEVVKTLKFTNLSEFILKEMGTVEDYDVLSRILEEYKIFGRETMIFSPSEIKSVFDGHENVVFEGAQGVLLDEWHGFHPYTTWSTTTFKNADDILNEIGFKGEKKKIGVSRTYTTRHGLGPFPSYSEELTRRLPDSYNGKNEWQGDFRCGWIDVNMLLYSQSIVGHIDYMSITHMDKIADLKDGKVCTGYKLNSKQYFPYVPKIDNLLIPDLSVSAMNAENLMKVKPEFESYDYKDISELIAGCLDAPIGILSYGPTYKDKEHVPLCTA